MAGEAVKVPFIEAAAPATPAASRVVIYAKADGLMYSKDDAGVETLMSGGAAGAGIPETLLDAAGDIIVASAADTAARLAIGAAGGALSRINGVLAYNSGTSFPTAATGDRFWRTDLGMECYFDGTRWVTTQLYREPLTGPSHLIPTTTTNTSGGRFATYGTQFDLWLVDLYTMLRVASPDTNDGSNFWSAALRKATAASSFSTIATVSTAAQAPAEWIHTVTALDVLLGTTHTFIDVNYAKTGSPGGLYPALAFSYRLVVT